MSIEMILAILFTAILFLLVLRGSKNKAVLLLTAVVAVGCWVVVGANWATNQWTNNFTFSLPDLKFLIFAIVTTGSLVLAANALGQGGRQAVIALLAALWLAGGMGWLAGEWSGVLAITMPSILILIVGLLALPPFVLPVPPLPWKWPTLFAMLYAFLWLIGIWMGWLEMNVISFWVYLQGMLLIMRPAFPLGSIKAPFPFIILSAYGMVVFVVWRVFLGFDLTMLNLLILTQGLLTLSCYTLPVKGPTKNWALGLSILYGLGYLSVMSTGRIDITLASFLILFLGVAAFDRFLLPGDDEWPISTVTAIVLFSLYAMIWASGLIIQDLKLDEFSLLIFAIGSAAIFMPMLAMPSANWETFRAIITCNLDRNYPYKAITGRKIVQRKGGDPFAEFLAGPGIILSDADHVVVIYSGGSFDRVSPPGITMTQTFEFDKEIVDLRVQLRTEPKIVAKTKDGIEVTIVTFTPLRIITNRRQPELGRPLPYDPDAVRRAVHAQRIAQKKDETQSRDKLVRHACEQIMRDIIAEFTLDELCGLEPRIEIAARMRDGVRDYIQRENLGLELIGGGISNIVPPPAVIEQRIAHWKAHWESQIIVLKAEAEAEEERMLEHARAEAQRELLRQITEGLEPLAGLDVEQRSKLMALSLLEAIGRAEATDSESAPATQINFPLQTLLGMPGPESTRQSTAGGKQ